MDKWSLEFVVPPTNFDGNEQSNVGYRIQRTCPSRLESFLGQVRHFFLIFNTISLSSRIRYKINNNTWRDHDEEESSPVWWDIEHKKTVGFFFLLKSLLCKMMIRGEETETLQIYPRWDEEDSTPYASIIIQVTAVRMMTMMMIQNFTFVTSPPNKNDYHLSGN